MSEKLSHERCEIIMAEKLNEIDINVVEKTPEATPYAGALPFMKMCEGMGLADIVNKSLHVRDSKGYTDSDHIFSMVTMQVLGGSSIDDLATLKQNLETSGSPFEIPSPTAARSYMNHFHDESPIEHAIDAVFPPLVASVPSGHN